MGLGKTVQVRCLCPCPSVLCCAVLCHAAHAPAFTRLPACLALSACLQVMALIAYLMEKQQNFGPHLIIVPNAGGCTDSVLPVP